jgi:hypothetical protein
MTPLDDLAWTQFWQVTTVAAGIGLFIRLCCRQRSHLAHVLWLIVLVKCLTPPLWSSPTSVFSWAARDSIARNASVPVDTAIGLAAKPVQIPATHGPISDDGEVPSSTFWRCRICPDLCVV